MSEVQYNLCEQFVHVDGWLPELLRACLWWFAKSALMTYFLISCWHGWTWCYRLCRHHAVCRVEHWSSTVSVEWSSSSFSSSSGFLCCSFPCRQASTLQRLQSASKCASRLADMRFDTTQTLFFLNSTMTFRTLFKLSVAEEGCSSN